MSDSPVSIIYDSNGDPIHVVEVNGEQHLGSAIVQDVQYSTANSSTSNLNSDSSFTGTSEALFGLTSIEVFCFSDSSGRSWFSAASNRFKRNAVCKSIVSERKLLS